MFLLLFSKSKKKKIIFNRLSSFRFKRSFFALGFLKKLIPYKLRGFFFPKQFILMKPGKKRF